MAEPTQAAPEPTGLSDRMKAYEQATRTVLPRRTYTICRVDGRAFHTFLHHADRPFDDTVMAAMDSVAEALCGEMSGAVFAFTQSDECSVLLTDFAGSGTEPWFGGVVQKMVSIASSMATVAFNRAYEADQGATFDARVFTVPSPVEVANYFLWRQRDAVRNSISMAAQAHFSHKRLHRVSTDQMQDLLWREAGINWNDYPAGCKRGRATVRRVGERPVSYTDRRTGRQVTTTAVRSWWETGGAPHFTANRDGWLAETIPPLPALTGGEGPESDQ
ncbi:tRNA(His) guanylyltransferase Thg1 family protein [Spirillospora sp. CA-128828]|uniref:tRNA(His) guanylyltransferase Thg1 family protein n=1 Tax=Spirillospora sp. CA-128828 TaxID=3240033 RepID=UPI003D9424CD